MDTVVPLKAGASKVSASRNLEIVSGRVVQEEGSSDVLDRP